LPADVQPAIKNIIFANAGSCRIMTACMRQQDKPGIMENKNTVREAAGNAMRSAAELLKKYFNAMPDKEDEQETIRSISAGVSFRGATLWVLVFAIFIASLGLNVNSTAVIIGAMLISPLMGPIIGMGLAVGINDFDLLKRSVKNYLVATVISVITATVYFLLTPLDEAQSELLARTSPTLYDVLIALCGGAAGFVALATKGKGNVLPGVAIATALMPPLCTAGFGLATGNLYYFLGAFYLFFINTVFISLATYIGARMMKFSPKSFVSNERYAKVRRYIIIAVVVTMVPAAFMTYSIVRESIFKTNVNKFVNDRLDNAGTRIISYDINKDSLTLRVVAVGRELTDSAIKSADSAMTAYKLGRYRLQVIQGYESDSVMMLSNKLANMRTSSDNYAAMFHEEANKSAFLQKSLYEYTKYGDMAPTVAKEAKALFPGTEGVSLAVASEASPDTTGVIKYVVAIVDMERKSALSAGEQEKMGKWLQTRLGVDTVRLIVRH